MFVAYLHNSDSALTLLLALALALHIHKWVNNNNNNKGLGLLDPAEGVSITRRNIGSYLPVDTA